MEEPQLYRLPPRAPRPSYRMKYEDYTQTRSSPPPRPNRYSLTPSFPSSENMDPIVTDNIITVAAYKRQRMDLRAAEEEQKAARKKKEGFFHRRRTEPTLVRNDLGHSAPTVQKSHLTASVSGNDLSQPSHNAQRYKFPTLRRDYTPTGSRPSRIPSPSYHKKVEGGRQVSTPILPSQRSNKETVPPQTSRLLGSISPARQPSAIPRSRTMGVFSTLTSSFSRSTLHISSSRHVSAGSTRVSGPTMSVTGTYSPPVPTFTTSMLQVTTAQLHSYWCGRYQALFDRFQTENLHRVTSDREVLSNYQAKAPPAMVPTPSLSNIAALEKDERFHVYKDRKGKTIVDAAHDFRSEHLERAIDDIVKVMTEEERERTRKALLHLDMLCITNEAKKSLWEWQVAQARIKGDPNFLPDDGTMIDVPKKVPGWAGRVGRAMVTKSETMSNLGGRLSNIGRGSGLGFKRKQSKLGMNNQMTSGSYVPLGETF